MPQDILQEKIHEVISISEADFAKKFFKSQKLYDQLVALNISVWKIFNDIDLGEIWVLDDTSKRYDVRPDASQFIGELSNLLTAINQKVDEEKLNISQYFYEVQQLLKQATIKNTPEIPGEKHKIPAVTKETLYNNIVKEFGLEHLPQEDRDEIIVELAKTVQKQFLLDIYDEIGERNFKALETSIIMGKDFYDTTLKHVVPNYEEVFKASREKVITAFKKTEASSE